MPTNEAPLVLVTEINEVVALDLCEALREAGYRVVGPVATAVDAERLLERERPDLAVIEPWLRDGPCTGMMDRLRRSGVPFVAHSAARATAAIAGDVFRASGADGAETMEAWAGAPWLVKPAVPWDVVIALDEMAIGGL